LFFDFSNSNAIIIAAAERLKKTRPTAVNLAWAVDQQLQALNQATSLEELQTIARNKAIAIADEKVSKNDKLNASFRALQDAENARDTAPDAYQTARVAYYTLLKGDTWVNEEKNRVANAEAQPVINNFLDKYRSLQYTRSRQQAVIDSMNNVKESVLGVKDDLDFSVSNFQKHIEDIKNKTTFKPKVIKYV
jgi:hypothetical protein